MKEYMLQQKFCENNQINIKQQQQQNYAETRATRKTGSEWSQEMEDMGLCV